ncbi:MAG TPA: tetratricopeptide repeat protein [Gaiellaceae bacterium]|nr:tetratricopeptide repeat protein [Gaiellaceae bacterium]
MARADRRRAQRARTPAVARGADVLIEDTMFFPRLRRHAKWMFVFLALAFGLGFVGFGVGAGGVGIGDIFRGTAGSGVPSIAEAEERAADNPRSPKAFRDLATAYQAKGRTDDAIEALERYLELRPRSVDVLRELAALYLAKAQAAQERAQIAQARVAYLAPGTVVEDFQLGGRPLEPDPITSAVRSRYEQEVSSAYAEAQQASAKAVDAYRRIARVQPNDPAVQLELAQAAQSAGDVSTAISAYERFLKLAPDDPTAHDVRRLLKQLRAQSG